MTYEPKDVDLEKEKGYQIHHIQYFDNNRREIICKLKKGEHWVITQALRFVYFTPAFGLVLMIEGLIIIGKCMGWIEVNRRKKEK